LERLTGKPIRTAHPIQRGYTPALRLHLTFADDTTAFAKIGTTRLTSGWLRREKTVYETLHTSFMPEMLGWEDDGENPILLLEDLSHAHWPPPWSETQIQTLLNTLPEVWNARLPNLPRLVDRPGLFMGWDEVSVDPEPFLSLELATEKWLDAALPVLLSIPAEKVVDGNALLHTDIRSDNLCFISERVILVDWNIVCLGNPDVDLGFFLPSLQTEGGPLPETILPYAGEIAGIVSGYFAAYAGQDIIPDAPLVRHIQQVQLNTALPWAVRALDLPPLDGAKAPAAGITINLQSHFKRS
ncbi:MAG: phosphotransferase, partial [Anaerolineales bacterium]|nr:phosphotransferase [Anaerolineales bacterium]